MPIKKDSDEQLTFDEAIAQAEAGYISVGHPHPTFSKKANNYGQIAMSEEEFRNLQEYLTSEENKGKCLPSFFQDSDMGVRVMKANMVNMFYEYEGDWIRMRRDPRCVSDVTLARYWHDEKFRACIKAYDDIFTLKAKGVITSLMSDEGIPPMVRLEAATRLLRAQDANNWDPGVRKQIVANKGSLQNTFLSKIATNDDVLKTLLNDPFSPLPDAVKEQIRISTEQAKKLLPDAIEIATQPTPDPFSIDDSNDEE